MAVDPKTRTSLNEAMTAALQNAPGGDEIDDMDGFAPDPDDVSDETVAPKADEKPAAAAGAPAATGTETPPATGAAPTTETPPDPFAEFETLEYEDDDGVKVPFRVPKAEAQRARNALTRTNIMSRSTGYASQYKRVLDPLIRDGRFGTYAELIELAEGNPQFAQWAIEGAQRLRQGLPLTPAQERALAAEPTRQAAPVEQPPADDPEDIFGVGAMIRKANAPLLKEIEDLKSERRVEREKVLTSQQFQAAAVAGTDAAYARLRARFPDEFDGKNDGVVLNRIFDHARTSGLIADMGADRDPMKLPAAMLTAKLEMDMERFRNMTTTAAPPAGATMAAVEASATRAANEAARNVAAATTGGRPGSPAAARPAAPVSVATRDKTGRRRDASSYIQDWMKTNKPA